jgi:uncharacterized protein YqgC (DUF456 family)
MIGGLEEFVGSFTIGFTLVVMLIGLFGMIIPIFPGEILMWLAALGYGLVYGFNTMGIVIFAFITLFVIAGILADNVLMSARARQAGATWWSLFFGLVGGVVGTFFFPPIGGLVGAPLALFGFEYLHHRDRRKAFAVTKALLIGWGWSFVARFGLGLLTILLWAVWVWSGTNA